MLRTTAIAALSVSALAVSANAQDADIVGTAEGTQEHTLMLQVLGDTMTAGGESMADMLRGDGPYTVFAPTDAAFGGLPEGELDRLMMDENEGERSDLLAYHVVEGEYYYEDFVGETTTLTSLQGTTLEIEADGSNPTVNGVEIVAADIEASNGVIHRIDGVLTPNLPD